MVIPAGGLIAFLVVVLVLVVVLYCVKLVMAELELTPATRKVVMLIVGLVALLVLLGAAAHAMGVVIV